jgi:formamidopyrimidine-DNA glycosylase
MNIKALLLNQALIAGIGNIYADEICHTAGVLPTRRTATLTSAEIKKLYDAANTIIKKAVKYRGTTFNNYIDSEGNKGNFSAHLKVYGSKNARCKTCKTGIIEKTKVAGRGTHFCRNCQK